jgi:hypothetical protein
MRSQRASYTPGLKFPGISTTWFLCRGAVGARIDLVLVGTWPGGFEDGAIHEGVAAGFDEFVAKDVPSRFTLILSVTTRDAASGTVGGAQTA